MTGDAQGNKELVGRWLAAGPWTEEGRAMVTSDFVWQAPRSEAELFGSPDAALHGPDELRLLPAIDKAVYADFGGADSNPHIPLLIAEGDNVVMEFEASFTTHTGEPYHNYYVFVIRVEDGKIAELREHADTKYFDEIVMGTPDKRAAVLERLARLRTEEHA
jgi:hypothetical protein